MLLAVVFSVSPVLVSTFCATLIQIGIAKTNGTYGDIFSSCRRKVALWRTAVNIGKASLHHCFLIALICCNALVSTGGQMSTRCFRRCTGCLLNSASTTSWPCWRSRLSRRHLRSIWASTSRCAPAHATLDRRPSYCCACYFDGHHLPGDRSALPHLSFGTHCHLLC